MIALATTFTEKGWSFKQLMREGKVAIYRRWRTGKEGVAAEEHYEVIRIREAQQYERFGQKHPAKEHYPTANQWGDYGWTLLDRQRADQKFHQIAHCAPQRGCRNRFEGLGGSK